MLNGQESNVANVLPDQHVNSDCKFKIVMETPRVCSLSGIRGTFGQNLLVLGQTTRKGSLDAGADAVVPVC